MALMVKAGHVWIGWAAFVLASVGDAFSIANYHHVTYFSKFPHYRQQLLDQGGETYLEVCGHDLGTVGILSSDVVHAHQVGDALSTIFVLTYK